MFEKFDIDDKNIFKVCVIATMSSGKSTFINSIIGEEVMPEKNEACTARTMAVLDNDAASVKKAHIIRKNGDKEILEIDSREVLDRVNNDEDIVDFLVESNIQSIKNTSRALILIDTPGVNNSEDEKHGKRTEEFLKQMDMGVIIYLMNATQLATNDDSLLLQLVSDHVKKKKGSVKIIFVINKIDALDLETESISAIVKIAKEYIQNHDISRPVIYPLSALAAKTLRMTLYRKEMTRRELRKLEDTYEHYRSKDNNMLAFAMLDDSSDETYEIGGCTVTAQELQRAIDNTGITAIEKKLEDFMFELEERYAPEIVIKPQLSDSTAQKFQKRIEKIMEFPSECEWNRFKELNAKIDETAVLQKANRELPNIDSIFRQIDLMLDLPSVTTDIDALVSNIEQTKSNVFDNFKKGCYILVKNLGGLYFSPEKKEDLRISAKNFYLMSENGSLWSAIHFENAVKIIDEGKEFFLYNDYSSFVFRVNKNNGPDTIALLDIMMPVRVVRIAGMKNVYVPINVMEMHIKNMEAESADREQKIKDAEEQLQRTYKGIVFKSGIEKEEVIKEEAEIQQFCQTLDQKNFEELWNKKKMLSKMPNAIFAPYITKLILAMDVQENKEKDDYLTEIEIADINFLSAIQTRLDRQHYSDINKNIITDALKKRKLQCQRDVLESIVKSIDTCSREALKEMLHEVQSGDFEDTLAAEYTSIINRQSTLLDTKELRQLCANVEYEENIQNLINLDIAIKSKEYETNLTEKYLSMIRARIESLHVKNLEEYCQFIETADRKNLSCIKEKVDKEDCSLDLKHRFYNLIRKQEENLDYKDLCDLTDKFEEKTLSEQEALYKQLNYGNYNINFVKPFLLRVRVKMELTQQQYVNRLVSDLQAMNKLQVIEIEHQIEGYGYADRVIVPAKKTMAQRLYILDMLELIALENDFDRLTLNDINKLRNLIDQKNLSDRSKICYKSKLKEREDVIALELVSPAACLARQLIDQLGISDIGLKIATFSNDYESYLERFKKINGCLNPGDIPILFFPAMSSLALSRTTLYCEVNNRRYNYPILDIKSFTIGKNFLSEVVIITLSNGKTITLSGGINKKNSQQVAKFLTILIHGVNNTSALARYVPYTRHVPELKAQDYKFVTEPDETAEQDIIHIMMQKYRLFENDRGKIPAVRYFLQEGWESVEAKVCKNFGIINERKIVMYYDRSQHGTASEGFAIGLDYIHIKQRNQYLISVPYADIYEIAKEADRTVLITITNNVFPIEFSLENEESKKFLVSLFNEFIQGMQFVNAKAVETKIRDNGIKETIGISRLENRCPNCNILLKAGAKFCSNCGFKIAANEPAEYISCTKCGSKIKKGKKFCSNCGTKIGEK